jgi:hypothetical protein
LPFAVHSITRGHSSHDEDADNEVESAAVHVFITFVTCSAPPIRSVGALSRTAISFSVRGSNPCSSCSA